MEQEKFNKQIEDIFAVLECSVEEKSNEHELYKFLLSKKEEFTTDPEDFYFAVNYDYSNIIDMILKTILNTRNHKVLQMYSDWQFFDSHVTRLCSDFYGGVCSADRGRYLCKKYIDYLITGEYPVFNATEYYSHPKKGTPKQWLDFIDSLQELMCGSPKNYFIAYRDLVNAHSVPILNPDSEPFVGTTPVESVPIA